MSQWGMANTAVKTGPDWKIPVLMLVIGIVVAMVGWNLGVGRVIGTSGVEQFDVPGTFEGTLDPGDYHVYGPPQPFTEAAFGNRPENNFEATDVTVTKLDTGETVDVRPEGFRTLGRGAEIHWSVAAFRVDEDARFSVTVAGGEDTSAIVFESPDSSWREAIPWAIATLGGAVLATIGLGFWILGMVRRSRVEQQSRSANAQPTSLGGPQPPPPAANAMPRPQSSPEPPGQPNQPPPPPRQ